MKAIKSLTAALLAGLTLTAAATYARDIPENDGHPEYERPMRMPTLERMAIGNALAAELAARSGRPAAEIETLLREQGLRKTAETLGFDRDTMKQALRSAREKVIDQAVQAQLITAAQAQTLKEAPAAWAHARHARREDKQAPQIRQPKQ
ncbi:hypothetical protein SAMN04488120_1172 [Fontimonas thermophila]|uniref:Heavy-metal resistance n=1 Tax=Fontimonas thermophila TaxID=1076937 RepID=A0A1I2KEJ5_9GAMM|nr:hypothetical protein [Fontimonas thermophila]SFF64788.1 hypothetical protein SAMN04488120_1172 [Fontimonas thermophila]